MRDAMGRVVTVNASRGSTGSAGEFGIGSIAEPDDYGRDFGISTSPPVGKLAQGADQGPCLYLGPGGQRCSRRASNAGFCAIHQPDGITATGISRPSKKLIASLLAIAAVVWPYLADIVREVIRWIHAH
jgi:hypothetical protein